MKIHRLNEKLTVQKNAVTVDKYGNHKNTWTPYYSCRTYAGTYQYDTEREAAVVSEEQTVKFEVRYCEALSKLDSTHYRISFHDDIYDIVSVDRMNYDRKTIRIICKLQTKGGAS